MTARRVLLQALASTPFWLAAADALAADIIEVGTGAELAAALRRATAGTTIVLANGLYAANGGFAIDAPGTGEAPIVIRAAERNKAVIASRLALKGRHAWLSGLSFIGAEAGLDIEGMRHKVRACWFEGWGSGFSATAAINMAERTDLLEIGYCRFTRPAPFLPVTPQGEYPLRIGIRGRHEPHRASYDLEVHHCHFADFPAKPTGRGYHSGQSDGIENAASGAMGLKVNHHFHHNLMQGMNSGDGGLIDLKACNGCVVAFNTFLDSVAPSGNRSRVDLRNGPNAIVEHNWLENTGGIDVLGRGHVVRGNRLINAGSISLIAGDSESETKTGKESAQACQIIGNEAPVYIGRDYGNRFPARGNIIQGNAGPVSHGPAGSHVDNTVIADGAREPGRAVRLRPEQVGPAAAP